MSVKIVTDTDELFTVTRDSTTANEGLYVDGNQVVGPRQTFVANASVAHALNATFSDTEVEAALNALGTKVNNIFTILKAHGLMASS